MSALFTAFSRLRPLALSLFLLLPAAVLSAGCAGKHVVDWNLTPSAQHVYHYLVLHEAIVANDPEMARQSLESLLALKPDMQIYRDGAEYYLLSRHYAEARLLARRGLEHFPGEFSLYLVISESYAQERAYANAADTLREFLTLSPGNVDALHELGRLYILMQRFADAEECLRRIPEQDRGSAVRYLLAMALLGQDKIRQGERELRRVVDEDPEFTDAWVNLAVAAQARGQLVRAADILTEALTRNPEDAALRLRLVEAFVASKRPDLALKTAEEFSSPTYRMESVLLMLDGKAYAQAETLLRRMLLLQDAPPEIYFYLAGIAYESKGNIKEALALLEHIPPGDELAEKAFLWRLDLLTENGDSEAARTLARERLEARPDEPESFIVAALTTQQAGDLKAAIALLQQGREKWPDHEILLYHLARFLYDDLQKEEGLRIMEEVILLNPGYAPALNFIGYSLAEEGRDLERAIQLLQRAVQEDPQDAHIADSLAWAQYQAGSYREAWETICRSIFLGGDHPVIWEHYGDIARKVGKKIEARKGYDNALRRKPENPDIIREKLRAL